jgi:ABC-type antimicrobial peptide transport system permease subunit
VRQAISELGPTLAPEFRTMNHVVSASVADRRFTLLLILAFSATALLLATLGVYSVVSYLVAQRRNEIGVRVALGAQTADVLRLILGEGARLTAAGVGLGVLGAVLMTRVLRGLVFGVSVSDPLAFTIAVAALALVALVATYVPARRATRVDPMDVIRAV